MQPLLISFSIFVPFYSYRCECILYEVLPSLQSFFSTKYSTTVLHPNGISSVRFRSSSLIYALALAECRMNCVTTTQCSVGTLSIITWSCRTCANNIDYTLSSSMWTASSNSSDRRNYEKHDVHVKHYCREFLWTWRIQSSICFFDFQPFDQRGSRPVKPYMSQWVYFLSSLFAIETHF